jgi:hypothetical protein
MNEFVRAALIGLGRDSASPQSGTPVDALVADGERERTFLLRAAARDLYLRAGLVPPKFEEPPAVAPAESLRSCSPRLTQLLADALDGDAEVVRAIGEAMTVANLHLPHRLLPDFLNTRDQAARAALAPAVGARGQWLARQNKVWSWAAVIPSVSRGIWAAGGAMHVPRATQPPDPSTHARDDMAALWEEGNLEQRVAALHAMRESDATSARAKLEAVWSKEKAEVRATLLAALSTSLSPDDETFLERALGDRSVNVKSVAENLLARLPQSAFVARMIERVAAVVQKAPAAASMWEKVKSGFGAKALKLIVEPPAAEGSGARARALAQLVAAVPLSHWTSQFDATPEQLLDAARATDWSDPLIEGWTTAVERQRDSAWAAMLLERLAKSLAPNQKLSLVRALSPEAVMQLLRGAASHQWPIVEMLEQLPAPWPLDFGADWLHCLQRAAARPPDALTLELLATIDITARALPLALHRRLLDAVAVGASRPTCSAARSRRHADLTPKYIGSAA